MSRADLVARLEQVDAALVAAGFPALSPFWKETFRAFLSGRKRTLVVRAGRRGGKSSSCARLAVTVALFGEGERNIPPGDVGVVAFISASRDEAANRLRTIRAILDALKVAYTERGDTIELANRPIAFRVFTASIAGVSGPTCIAVFADEVSKWKDADTGANPAKEVLASVRPTMATIDGAFLVMLSSPFSTLDAHHDAYARGTTEDQDVVHAPTWIANPTITEEQTHELEPDIATWTREYAAEPTTAGSVYFFDHDAIDAAVDASLRIPTKFQGCAYSTGIDPAFVSDAAAAIVTARVEGKVVVAALEERVPQKGTPLDPDIVVGDFAKLALAHGCTSLWTDVHAFASVLKIANGLGVRVLQVPSGAEGKAKMFTEVRNLLSRNLLRLPSNAPRLVRSLKEVTSKPTEGGALKISSPRRKGNHGDQVSAYVASVWGTRGMTFRRVAAAAAINGNMTDRDRQREAARSADINLTGWAGPGMTRAGWG